LALVGSPNGRDGSVTVHQDVGVFAGQLEPGKTISHSLAAGRHAWVHVARGSTSVNGQPLQAGDSAGISGELEVALRADASAEVLLFDLA
jgi:redox-sensitive bicupin YhaK (pirin superfamily)